MLRLDDLHYSIQGRPLLVGATARIPAGHKVGLVGRNGTGKTTLFRLIRGELSLDSGEISMPRQTRIGGIAQEVPSSHVSLIDTVLAADTERAALMAEAEVAVDAHRIAEVHVRLADIDAWSAEARAASILSGLGFTHAEQAQPCAAFSGGWRMRVALAGVLFAAPDLLLLDEPTNYLDLEGALWLESYLAKYPHTVLIVSHDRELLNRAVTGILHLVNRKLSYYTGPYDSFARQRAARLEGAQAANRKQEARRAHLQSFVDRFRAKASKAKQAQSRLKMLEKMQPIGAPEEAKSRAFSFPEPEELSPPILALEDVAVGYDGTPVLRNLSLRLDQDDRIALLGRNGEGKSTLAKLLSGRLEALSGELRRNTRLRIGYFAQHQLDELDAEETPIAHIRRHFPEATPPRLRARLAGFGIGRDQADTAVGRLSGGQKARLALLLATIDAPHLLILDEPTNHLDIESREALVEALTEYTGAVILISHDMHLLSLVADRLWLVSGGQVHPFSDDLAAYRRLLLAPPAKARTPKKRASAAKAAPQKRDRPARNTLLALRSDARRAEARVKKLTEMRDTLDARLASPENYARGMAAKAAIWQRKRAEVVAALERAETLWIGALESLESGERER